MDIETRKHFFKFDHFSVYASLISPHETLINYFLTMNPIQPQVRDIQTRYFQFKIFANLDRRHTMIFQYDKFKSVLSNLYSLNV